jgi:Undecaprenyl-phosphate glucose phosphotransferase
MTKLMRPDIVGRATVGNAPPVDDMPHLTASVRPAGRIERLLAKVIAVEFLVVATASFLTSLVYFTTVLTQWPPVWEYAAAALLIATLVLLAAFGFKQYVGIQAQPRDRYLWGGLGIVALTFSLFLSMLFVLKIAEAYSRGTFFSQFVVVSVAVLIARGAIHSHVRRAIQSGTIEARRAVLVGDAKANSDILKNLEQFGIRWAGILRLPYVHGHTVPGIEAFSSNIRTFVERCRALKPDDIIFLAEPTDLPRVALLVNALSELPVTAHVIPTEMNELWGAATIAYFGSTATVQVLRPPLSAFDLAVKRAFDISVAGAGLLLLSPLMLIVALAIKVDSPGPVFFRQNRHGYNNEVIPVIKFRTMTVVEDGETATTFTQARANDTRITRLGHMLRRSNIDELPQLFNVLRGNMSLIGPRPHPIALNAIFQERIAPFSRRHNVKPGITGWAQVNGFRGETDTVEKMQRRIEYDLYYIDNWSFMLDLKIVVMTLFSRRAYTNAC